MTDAKLDPEACRATAEALLSDRAFVIDYRALAAQLTAAAELLGQAEHWKQVAIRLDDEKHQAQDEVTKCSTIALENTRERDAAQLERDAMRARLAEAARAEIDRRHRLGAERLRSEVQALAERLEHTSKLAGLWTGPTGEPCRTCGRILYDHIGTDLYCPERPALTADEVRAVVSEAAMDEWPTWINWPIGQSGSPREIAEAIAASVAEKLAGRTLVAKEKP